ncbi:aldo-keto reductase, variant 2 [Coprinopsis cinerea AmutBmut pab1-1]|nr:aldo-keto reductase, variant 2 [Coprinopsis cinerea AmutBmut pab1-1]
MDFLQLRISWILTHRILVRYDSSYRSSRSSFLPAIIKRGSKPGSVLHSRMSTVKLNDGNQIPWLGFGTGTALYNKDATDNVRLALDNGVVHLDGAQVYGNEESIGAAIKATGKPRSELFITTKLKPGLGFAPGQSVKETLQESLKKLGIDYVDLFLVHSPSPANKEGRLQDLWRQVEGMKRDGLAKSIGVSNFRVEDLNTILSTAEIVPAVNQIELHPYVWKQAEPIYNLNKEKGIVTASYSGLTPLTHAVGGPLDAVLPDIRARLEKARGAPVSTGQVLTKWLLQKGVVVITYAPFMDFVNIGLADSLLTQNHEQSRAYQGIPGRREDS